MVVSAQLSIHHLCKPQYINHALTPGLWIRAQIARIWNRTLRKNGKDSFQKILIRLGKDAGPDAGQSLKIIGEKKPEFD